MSKVTQLVSKGSEFEYLALVCELSLHKSYVLSHSSVLGTASKGQDHTSHRGGCVAVAGAGLLSMEKRCPEDREALPPSLHLVNSYPPLRT